MNKEKIKPAYCPNCKNSDSFGYWRCEYPCLFCLHNGIFRGMNIPGQTKDYFELKEGYKK